MNREIIEITPEAEDFLARVADPNAAIDANSKLVRNAGGGALPFRGRANAQSVVGLRMPCDAPAEQIAAHESKGEARGRTLPQSGRCQDAPPMAETMRSVCEIFTPAWCMRRLS